MTKLIVIGAGIGGLAAASVLARAGIKTTVLEAHVYPGGAAGTFYHQGYQFDAGATLAGGFYPGGPMDLLSKAAQLPPWPIKESNRAMEVHLPGGLSVTRWGDERRWSEYTNAFGGKSLNFWRWQEKTADSLWDLALLQPSWPPQTPSDLLDLAGKGIKWINKNPVQRISGVPSLALDAVQSVDAHLKGMDDALKLFIDGQLLISAQTTSRHANALYGAAALDLPRRGVAHLIGGMGAISRQLVQSIRDHNGQVIFREEVSQIRQDGKSRFVVETNKKNAFEGNTIIANLTPWNIVKLTSGSKFPQLKMLPVEPPAEWGAFMIYVGFDGSIIPSDYPLHHQLIISRPLGEGNSIFLSISPEWDSSRAPEGKRAMTISTHTNLRYWWNLFARNREGYEVRRNEFALQIMKAAEDILPGLREAVDIMLPGTPVTFQRFTRRLMGWVGGFQQTSLLRGMGPKLGPNFWMVGDSIFPGQSVAATALGGLRVANTILHTLDIPPFED